MKKWTVAAALLAALTTNAQTLFTYGKDSVTVPEFLQSYRRNKTGTGSSTSLKTYLDLYIHSKLKVQEARERGYDTLPQFRSDLQNLRAQLLPAYLNDAETIKQLTDEAHRRSLLDVRVSHIFIGWNGGDAPRDTASARKKAEEAYARLQGGQDFASVARAYSEDPSAAQNGGNLGFITVFTLPYELENVAYTTPLNAVSPLFRSRSGYHIFKKTGERKALGRISAAQILLAVPPGSGEAERLGVKKLADSLYQRLLKGDDFAKLVSLFSHDYISAAAGGLMPEFGVGQYEPEFEDAVRTLPKGGLSKPLVTSYGYHIIRKIGQKGVTTDRAGAEAELKARMEGNDRMETARRIHQKKILERVPVERLPVSVQDLRSFTDSALDGHPFSVRPSVTLATPLFRVGGRAFTAADWISFAGVYRFKPDGSGVRPFEEVWQEFAPYAAMEYYRNNLEEFNPAFRSQLEEFRDGNLFFEIMQREIWGRAQNDTAALQQYYLRRKEAYRWTNSADAVFFYTADAPTARQLAGELKGKGADWRRIAARMGDKVTVDSGRFELEELPNPAKLPLKRGTVTGPVANGEDGGMALALVLNVHTEPALRTFAEARGQVINDYQKELEAKWMKELKEKYKVTINQKAVAALPLK